jgi:2-amino-4-hydroxy-6-hydroxymethyldihydropteridine diphosphokinase
VPNHHCLIAFGSNLGDESSVFQQSLEQLGEDTEIEVVAHSEPVRTKPVGGPSDQPDYLNAAIRLRTSLSPDKLHQRTSKIEQQLGRQRRVRWGARKVDLDILLYDKVQLETDRLVIPHPRMSFRRFVLEPASEIAADMVHPTSGLTIAELVNYLDRTPNEIIWLAADRRACEKRRDDLCAQPSLNGWLIHVVDEIEDYQRLVANAKLVASSRDVSGDLAKVHFSGPTLRLPLDADRIEAEMVAAVEAMTN